MSKKKFTDWFPASVKPPIAGWYERQYGNDILNKMFDWWDGENFWLGWGAYDNKPNLLNSRISDTPRMWRGLASDPNA